MSDKYAHLRFGHGDRSCYKKDGGRKIRWHDEDSALNAATKARVLNGDNAHPYECPVCGSFHIGRRMIEEDIVSYA